MPTIRPISEQRNSANAQLELYAKLAEAEAQAASGETGADFSEFAKKLRGKVHGAI